MKQEDVEALLTKLQEEWPVENLVSFSELDMSQKLQDWPYQIIRFGEKLLKERIRLRELEDMKTRRAGKVYDELKFDNDKLLTKQEIEQYYLPQDEKMIKVNAAIEKQSVIVNYFEMATKVLEKMQWNVKLYMDDRKYSG